MTVLYSQQDIDRFIEWIGQLSNIAGLHETESIAPELLAVYLRWAAEAKWRHSEALEAAFHAQEKKIFPWILNVYKLGRYAIAAKVMVRLALDVPARFCPMRVEAIQAPPIQSFFLKDTDKPLTQLLRRTVGEHQETDIMGRLGRVWETESPEKYFRTACKRDLTVHAEMQLVIYCDEHPEAKPWAHFLGVSKKSCFLCQRFLALHAMSFRVSSCHEKLYPAWQPPPSKSAKIFRQYKQIFTSLIKVMDSMARADLEGRLGLRREATPDSTAGMSLPSSNLERPVLPTLLLEYDGEPEAPDLTSSDLTVSLGPATGVIDAAESVEQDEPRPRSHAIYHLTFRVQRADNDRRQDLVALSDTLDPVSGQPSWEHMVRLLSGEENLGIAFDQQREFLLVNGNLRVCNPRQFQACLQFLRNSGSLNNEVVVHPYSSPASQGSTRERTAEASDSQ